MLPMPTRDKGVAGEQVETSDCQKTGDVEPGASGIHHDQNSYRKHLYGACCFPVHWSAHVTFPTTTLRGQYYYHPILQMRKLRNKVMISFEPERGQTISCQQRQEIFACALPSSGTPISAPTSLSWAQFERCLIKSIKS